MSYERDANGVIINTDDTLYRSIVTLRESKKQRAQLETEVTGLKNELSQIKEMLTQLTHSRNS